MTEAAIDREGTLLRLRGPLNLASVTAQYTACRATAAAAGLTVDLSEVGPVDSSALAMLIALRREVEAAGARFELRNPPAALRTLAGLYGVGFLLDNSAPDA